MRKQPFGPGLAVFGAAVLALSLSACDDSPATEVAGLSSGTEAAAHLPGNGNGKAVYMADLEPLNANAALGIEAVSGKAILSEHKGQIKVKINATGLDGETFHLQHIHAGTTCPTAAQDTNGDGFIDVAEGAATYGAIIVPLDSDLADLTNQFGGFPTPNNEGGAIHYKAEASLTALNSSLQAAIGENLDLTRRHIVLHSVAPTTDLPPTVATIPGVPAQLTLPVACGEITLVNDRNN